MRIFTTLQEALSEIGRDLYKSPRLISSRVQNLQVEQPAREAMDYAYTILPGGIPSDPQEIVRIGQQAGFPVFQETSAVLTWIQRQLEERLNPLGGMPLGFVETSDMLHPLLKGYVEGSAFSYCYGERMIGAVEVITDTLMRNRDSRRCFWPIFRPEDALRMGVYTRIPCTLGYHLMIRVVPHRGDCLHLTLVSRSCDYQGYWLTDVFFAFKLQEAVLQRLNERLSPSEQVRLGGTSHVVLSFHLFEQGEEVY